MIWFVMKIFLLALLALQHMIQYVWTWKNKNTCVYAYCVYRKYKIYRDIYIYFFIKGYAHAINPDLILP